MARRGLDNLDLGSVQVHKTAIAEIAYSAATSIDGVSFPFQSITSKLYEYLTLKIYPGVKVDIDENHNISIEVKVIVRFRLNIADIAAQIQETIKNSIEQMVDINLKDINVNVVGVERGQA